MSDPRHAAVDRWFRRNYHFDGQVVPSVTTIGKAMRSSGLEQWKIRRAIDLTLSTVIKEMKVVHLRAEANPKGERHYSGVVNDLMKQLDKRTAASDQGVAVHEALDSWFSTGHVPATVSDAEAPYVEQAIRWAEDTNPKPLYMEPEVYSSMGYAGSIDFLAEIDGVVCVLDFKTGSYFESTVMQLAAYAHAERLYPRTSSEPCPVIRGGACECEYVPMPAIDRVAVLDLKPDRYELQWVTPNAFGLGWKAFQGALWMNRLKAEKGLFIPAPAKKREEVAA